METIKLWHEYKSANTGCADDDFQPFLEVYTIESKVPRGAVLVCPGGGYAHRAPHEAGIIAKKFNAHGFHAFVVQYRVSPYRFPAPQEDVFRAVKLIRANAEKWKVKQDKIAVLGFSAGGHLAASSGTLFDDVTAMAGDDADKYSQRPDALILCYPVISSGPFAHNGSFDNLLGADADAETRQKFSLEERITPDTPPAFLWHTAEDAAVPVENSLFFATSLRKHKIPFDLHVFPLGRHGLGLAEEYPNIAVWPELCATWLKDMDW
jgi:acetyl esterase/lipase